MLRQPAVSGRFYKASAEALRKQVEEFVIPNAARKKALGIVSPHAGLMYSGPVAGAVYSSIELPDTLVLIGPNHTGLGAPVSIMTSGEWETPLGKVQIDESLAAAILAKSSSFREDPVAHLREHSLEVQLPFIQYFKSEFKIVPIQMQDVRLQTCLEVGKAIAAAIMERYDHSSVSMHNAEPQSAIRNLQSEIPGVLIVASSDMSHYESAKSAKEKDFKAIQHILDLDPEGLHRTVRNYDITMCGYGPTVAMLAASKILGASKAELIKYTNSGDVSGDYEQVVGYAGVVIS